MAEKTFIQNIDTALRNLIWNGLKDQTTERIIVNQEQISFSSPKDNDPHGNRKLSIFLYNISRGSSENKNCAFFALSYLLTPFTGNDTDDHLLLGKVIQIFSETPQIICSGTKANEGLAVKIDSLSLDSLIKLWNALGTPFRISLSLTISNTEKPCDSKGEAVGAVIPPEKTPADTGHAAQLHQLVLNTFAEESKSWKNRNIFVREWVLQDFKRNTSMDADEMLSLLDDLGETLKQHGSAARFVKPMGLLLGYYEHQLEQLKGAQRVTHRQKENIKTVNAWIKNVKDLLEALGKSPNL